MATISNEPAAAKAPTTKRTWAARIGCATTLLLIVGWLLWASFVAPHIDAPGRIAVATRFLEAYVGGDCARALTFLDRPEDLRRAHAPAYTDPATFCTENAIEIVQSNPPRDSPVYTDLTSEGGDVRFDGIFLMTDPIGDTYPCPQISVSVDRRGGRLTVLRWEERWARSLFQPYGCSGLMSLDPSSSRWPDCSERSGIARRLNIDDASPRVPYASETGTPGIALSLSRRDDHTIEVAVDGLKPPGIYYIFFTPTVGFAKDSTGVVPFYTLAGRTYVFAGGRSAEIDPWVMGRFTYQVEIQSLPNLPANSEIQVNFVHPGGVACASVPVR